MLTRETMEDIRRPRPKVQGSSSPHESSTRNYEVPTSNGELQSHHDFGSITPICPLVHEINLRELGNVPTGRQPSRHPELLARCQRTAFKTDRRQRTKQLAEKVEPGVSPTPFHPRRSQHNHIMSPHSARLFFNCSLCHHSSLLPDHCHGNLARLCASCFCVVREPRIEPDRAAI